MIAVVIPTIRPAKYKDFLNKWRDYFDKPGIILVTVLDGEKPTVNGKTAEEVMGKEADLIYNFNDGVRNLGFAYVAKELNMCETIISFDDDVEPDGDTIQQHLDALSMRVPITWMSTASKFTRGFPYKVRDEAEVVLSHGVWKGVADWDASTQLVKGNEPVDFYKGVIPKGCLFPLCAMNFAFKRKLLPYIYQAPMFGDLNRFADIWGGIEAKKDIDREGWAVVTGYSAVNHNRASNVFDNIIKESHGLKMNENYGESEYFNLYKLKRERWTKWIKSQLSA